MNTSFTYSYRDASNYKQHETLVIQGQMKPADISMIMNTLETGIWFLPHQVGLPTLQHRFDDLNEDDHVWHELPKDGIRPTGDEPTYSLTAVELVHHFENVARWDIDEAHSLLWLNR